MTWDGCRSFKGILMRFSAVACIMWMMNTPDRWFFPNWGSFIFHQNHCCTMVCDSQVKRITDRQHYFCFSRSLCGLPLLCK